MSSNRAIHRAQNDAAATIPKYRVYRPENKFKSSKECRRTCHTQRGPPGPAGPPGTCSIDDVCEQVAQCSEAKSQPSLTSPQPTSLPMVAFTAVLANSNVTVNESTKKTIVKFDDIVLNEVIIDNEIYPGGYSSHNGTFVAPIDGIYQFSLTILQNDRKVPTFVTMPLNDHKNDTLRQLCSLTTQGHYSTASCTINTRMTRDQSTHVHLLRGEIYGHQYAFTSFTGNLIGL